MFLKNYFQIVPMPTLIACLSTGKGTWVDVNKIMHSQPWSNIFLITNTFGKEHFTPPFKNIELIELNPDDDLSVLIEHIKKSLKSKITDFEVAVNFSSGSGKEHMAVLEAILEHGLNFRIVGIVNGNTESLGLKR